MMSKRHTQTGVSAALGEGLFYNWQLRGPAPDRLLVKFDDPYTSDATSVSALLDRYESDTSSGRAGVDFVPGRDIGLRHFWRDLDMADVDSDAFWAKSQGFAFLRHLRGSGVAGLSPARALVDGWLEENQKYAAESWAARLTAERLISLYYHADWLIDEAPTLWRSKLLTSMARQTRHLAKTAPRVAAPVDRLVSAIALTMAGLSLARHEGLLDQGSNLLRRELRLQVSNDGGHTSRNPSFQLRLAIFLQGLITGFKAREEQVPAFLSHTAGRVTSMVEFFRSGDGRLAVFNGSVEDDPKALVTALGFDHSDRMTLDFASGTGYQRLVGGKTKLLADIGAVSRQQSRSGTKGRSAGKVPPHLRIAIPFEGAFAFQLVTGRQRLIVNCGNAEDGAWADALRLAGAHSTLSLATPPAKVTPAKALVDQPWHRLHEDDRGQLLELERSDIPDMPGATHSRRLFLTRDGDDLRGEDTLILASGRMMPDWVLRFHIHPTVKVSISRDGNSVLMTTPMREGWTFNAGSAQISLEKSIYAGDLGQRKATEQIVVRPDPAKISVSDNAARVKWAFKRQGHSL